MRRSLHSFVVVASALAWTAPAAAFVLPDTGQVRCYQDISPYAEMPCVRTGQDGAYLRNSPTYTDNGDGTVTDDNTGLMWQQQDDGATYNWFVASGTYHALHNPSSLSVCGSLVTGGHDDWRLPSKKELMTIVDYERAGPSISVASFPNTKSEDYWTSTASLWSPLGSACAVDFRWGNFPGMSDVASSYFVRCVRGTPIPLKPALVDNANGTVTDTVTGLVWQQDEAGAMTWGEALGYCEGLTLGGETSWRLPNVKELESLSDDTRYNPSVDPTMFPGVVYAWPSGYWSSTTETNNPWGRAWFVPFDYGAFGVYNKPDAHDVRCVRGGTFVSAELHTATWGQGGPHMYDYDGDGDGTLEKYVAGCSAIAVGQLIDYYLKEGYRQGWLETMLKGVTVYPRFCDTNAWLGIGCRVDEQTLPGYSTRTDYVDYIAAADSPGAPRVKRFLWNVAIGLDSQFVENRLTSAGGRYWTELLRSGDKYVQLLRDRFRFKDGMAASPWLTRLDAEGTYIKDSIDNRQPVLVALRLTKNGSEGGHLVLIDGYRETAASGLVFTFNWGWQNVAGENDRYFTGTGPFAFTTTVKGKGVDWVVYKFKVFRDTVPVNY